MFLRIFIGIIALICGFLHSAHADYYPNHPCGPIYHKGMDVAGPWDFRDPSRRGSIKDINKYHFNKAERELRKSAPNSHRIHSELAYTLIRTPNHHGALYLLAKLHKKFPKEAFNPPVYDVIAVTPECFFDRAIRFVPSDIYVPLIKGIYYHTMKRHDTSLSVYTGLLKKYPNWGELHYNLGLLYMDMGDYDKAVTHAKKAYGNNHALPGLKNKLERIGKWR